MSLNLEYERAINDAVGAFRFEEKDYLCEIIRRDKESHWCGYIFINSYHPWYGKHYDNIEVNCHGGLTYSQYDENMWKIGFDCAHWGDFVPTRNIFNTGINTGIWRDRKYVENECNELVEQAIEADRKYRDGVII